jgi:fructose-1,6-bisphosphatase/inositol monophosphatase family enzyme
MSIREPGRLLGRLRRVHAAMRDAVVAACEREALDQASRVVDDGAGDTVYAIDRVSEAALLEHFEPLAREWPLLLIAEGLGGTGRLTLPHGAAPEIAVLVDPIDGTRGLMYQKRPAWILTGVAPYRDGRETLADIEIALQTEIPLVKQHLSDSVWTADGRTATGERFNRLTGEGSPLAIGPTKATTIEQGFGNLSRFFPGGRALMGEIDDALVERVLGPAPAGRALAFEDQYISSGGQLYELLMGHDRWCADLRSLVRAPGRERPLCCHPYDLATECLARAAGVIVTDARGRQLDGPLDTETDIAWIGYANDAIRRQIAPTLTALLEQHGLLG